MGEKRTPSLSRLTFDEFNKESERKRKEPIHLKYNSGQTRSSVKKVLAVVATIGALVAGSMYVGSKYEKQISAIENAVTSYVSSSADNQTYAAEVTNKE